MDSKKAIASLNSGLRHVSVARFLCALLVLLATIPFSDDWHGGRFFESVALTAVMLFAVAAVGGRRRTFVIAAVLVVPAVVAHWVQHFVLGHIYRDVSSLFAMIFTAFVIWQLIRYVLNAPQVDDEVLCAGVATWLMLGLLWMFAYMMLSRHVPGSFTSADVPVSGELSPTGAMFLSFGTIANCPVADVAPATKVARLLMISQATCGLFYVTVFIARLVAVYATGQSAR